MSGYYNKRRRWNGYTNMGPTVIPPLPQYMVLTDRADGTLWFVSFNPTAPTHLTSNNDPTVIALAMRSEGVRIYAASDGPFMDEDGEFMLIVRSGRLGFDYNVFPVGLKQLSDAPQYARKASLLRLLKMDNTSARGHIGYTE